MTNRKKNCKDCCAYTITFSAENCDFIWETLDTENIELKKQRRPKKSIETFVNEMLNSARKKSAGE